MKPAFSWVWIHSPDNSECPVSNGSVGLNILRRHHRLVIWNCYGCQDSLLLWCRRAMESHGNLSVSVPYHRHLTVQHKHCTRALASSVPNAKRKEVAFFRTEPWLLQDVDSWYAKSEVSPWGDDWGINTYIWPDMWGSLTHTRRVSTQRRHVTYLNFPRILCAAY